MADVLLRREDAQRWRDTGITPCDDENWDGINYTATCQRFPTPKAKCKPQILS